jgi:hypothetical protein
MTLPTVSKEAQCRSIQVTAWPRSKTTLAASDPSVRATPSIAAAAKASPEDYSQNAFDTKRYRQWHSRYCNLLALNDES